MRSSICKYSCLMVVTLFMLSVQIASAEQPYAIEDLTKQEYIDEQIEEADDMQEEEIDKEPPPTKKIKPQTDKNKTKSKNAPAAQGEQHE